MSDTFLKQITQDAAGNIIEIREVEAGSLILHREQINFSGSLAAAKALAAGKSLHEALDIGAMAPQTDVLFNDGNNDAESAPDPDEPSLAPDPDPAELKRRYLTARINCARNPDFLSDGELLDSALVLDLNFIPAAVWKHRVTS